MQRRHRETLQRCRMPPPGGSRCPATGTADRLAIRPSSGATIARGFLFASIPMTRWMGRPPCAAKCRPIAAPASGLCPPSSHTACAGRAHGERARGRAAAAARASARRRCPRPSPRRSPSPHPGAAASPPRARRCRPDARRGARAAAGQRAVAVAIGDRLARPRRTSRGPRMAGRAPASIAASMIVRVTPFA